MVEETAVKVVKSEEELLKELQAAMAEGNMKKVIEVAGELKRAKGEYEKKERDATVAKANSLAKEMEGPFSDFLLNWLEKIEAVVPKEKISVVCKYEADKPIEIKLSKTMPKLNKTSVLTAPAHKFELSTEQLLEMYGEESYKKDDPTTFKAAYAASTDKNHRFSVRKALITRHIKGVAKEATDSTSDDPVS